MPSNAMSCDDICAKLSTDAGGYSKHKGCRAPITAEMVKQAVERALRLDANPGEIPTTPATRIYRILESLIQRESIVIN
jgi:hypothetical protein